MANQNSDIYTKQIATGASLAKIPTRDLHGKLRYARINMTIAGAAIANNDTVNLFLLPPNGRILLSQSTIKFSATCGASTTIDIGNRAYRNRGGVLVAEDADSIINGWDATTVVLEALPTSTVAFGTLVDVMQTVKFDSQEPVPIFLTALDSGGTFDGDIGDTWDFEFFYVTD